MKFAFSTVSCPALGLDAIIARAREWGYDGVEIFQPASGPSLTGSNVFLTESDRTRRPTDGTGVEIACIATTISMTGRAAEDREFAKDIERCIDTAQRLGCRRVSLRDRPVRPGQDRAAIAVALGDWLVPLGDYAAQRDVTLVMENALGFRRARDMWRVLDRISHPAVACCWDLLGAAQIGEGPDISVPVLNTRIAHATVADARFTNGVPTFCRLGEGDVPVQKFITRLRGIGYRGYVTFKWQALGLSAGQGAVAALGDSTEVLRDAIAKLKTWRGDANPRRAVKETQHSPTKSAKSGPAPAHA